MLGQSQQTDVVADHFAIQCQRGGQLAVVVLQPCLLYTSDAADERSSVDLGGRRIIKKKNKRQT